MTHNEMAQHVVTKIREREADNLFMVRARQYPPACSVADAKRICDVDALCQHVPDIARLTMTDFDKMQAMIDGLLAA